VKQVAKIALTVLFGVVLGACAAEAVARMMEGPGFNERLIHEKHPRLGWVPRRGTFEVTTAEYRVTYEVNDHGMNDRPVEESVNRARIRIVALGDSNTFGQGVSQREAWPNVLEELLFGDDPAAGTVYNLGVIGYSLGQYLVRMRELQDVLKPQLVIIGFTMHNDLYDVVPPGRGGFVLEPRLGRVYFDLDPAGRLVESQELVGRTVPSDQERRQPLSDRVKDVLRNSALYRRYRRSDLAMLVAAQLRLDESFLPGVDTALKRSLSADDEYRWRLAGRIIERIASEARAHGAKVMLVSNPHIPQAYDDLWASSFGTRPEQYDRWIGSERLAQICREAGIPFVDATPRFAEESRRQQRRFHYRRDRHPDREGHRIIAETVRAAIVESGVLE
jgi:lysophospholipase L1-like esterase